MYKKRKMTMEGKPIFDSFDTRRVTDVSRYFFLHIRMDKLSALCLKFNVLVNGFVMFIYILFLVIFFPFLCVSSGTRHVLSCTPPPKYCHCTIITCTCVISQLPQLIPHRRPPPIQHRHHHPRYHPPANLVCLFIFGSFRLLSCNSFPSSAVFFPLSLFLSFSHFVIFSFIFLGNTTSYPSHSFGFCHHSFTAKFPFVIDLHFHFTTALHASIGQRVWYVFSPFFLPFHVVFFLAAFVFYFYFVFTKLSQSFILTCVSEILVVQD